MVEAINKLKKLRGRSLDELRVRGAQALCALGERHGWSAQTRLPTDSGFFNILDLDAAHAASRAARRPHDGAELLEHFRARRAPRFFAAFDDRRATLAEFHARFGAEYEGTIISRAERILAGKFDLLGLRDLSFGDPIDWHLEPVSGKRAPLTHWSRIDYLDSSVAGDKKITWELNRQQHFMILGRTYWLTGDERYAEAFAAHLSSWIGANPPKRGINWASSLEVSFRAISWLWALNFFKDSPHLAPELFTRALKFLYLHARHLETYLSTYFSPNTHLTGEALGLYYLGTLLPELRDATRWRETGRRVLMEQLARHVRADGTYFEQSSYYHRYTADFYTHFLALARANGERSEPRVEQKLAALLDHLMFVTRPDGTTPLYGDDDGGKLALLEEGRGADDFRSALSNGAAIFSRPDYKFVAREVSEETLWLFGRAGLEAFDAVTAAPPARTSVAFRDGGYFVMRDGWSEDTSFMLIDCGEHGADNCGHAHADALSFDLAAHGRRLLVDPGTYTYTGSGEMRDHFRSTSAHNTLTIDGEPSSVPARAFQWKHVARSTLRRWINGSRFDLFEGAHDGYARLASPATHARTVLFLKTDYWIVRDAVETEGEHAYELRFHFAPGVEPSVEDDEGERVLRVREGGAVALELFAPDGAGEWRMEDGWVSRCYAQRERAAVGVRARRGAGRQEFYTFVVPRAANELEGAAVSRVREVEAAGGRAFELRRGSLRDVLIVGDGRGAVEAGGIVTDFGWVWLRFDADSDAPRELVAVAGSRLAVGGAELLRAEVVRVEHDWARREDGAWRVADYVGAEGSAARLFVDQFIETAARGGSSTGGASLAEEIEREVVGQN
ncbi:MAG: hypothetical protein QOF61_1941 [Acidobacteriota bacterium]|nr:hypothetical protein [Acidobacteriota bacterium]